MFQVKVVQKKTGQRKLPRKGQKTKLVKGVDGKVGISTQSQRHQVSSNSGTDQAFWESLQVQVRTHPVRGHFMQSPLCWSPSSVGKGAGVKGAALYGRAAACPCQAHDVGWALGTHSVISCHKNSPAKSVTTMQSFKFLALQAVSLIVNAVTQPYYPPPPPPPHPQNNNPKKQTQQQPIANSSSFF